jgi:2-C-methyl-D-erythritol 4-phosphate cytidylyltransferase/2-C-methyl-D-erythritol 2,4-cyclodiphosphate synthase
MTRKTSVIIPAAGSGTRMKAEMPKQYLLLGNIPILVHTTRAFINAPGIDELIIVVPRQYITETRELFDQYHLPCSNLKIVGGGRRRQDSVYCGIEALGNDISTVLVHDGARPLISQALIARCIRGVASHGAIVAAIAVKDTIKKISQTGQVTATVDRTALFLAQTPQAARKELLLEAYRLNKEDDVTDESSLLEKAGIAVSRIEGEETNLKITSREDLALAEQLIKKIDRPGLRIGHGYDAHRFAEGRKLVLGGVTIPHHHGLAGHSDADVLTHALCDALLGAAGAGDIGRHFPDTDDSFKNIYSIILLEKTVEYLKKKGYTLANADITVVCQAPKLAPYLEKIRTLLAASCGTEPENINIKATTTEKMGFTGRKEGIGCHVVALLYANHY